MKKGLFVLLISVSVFIAAFIIQVRGQWAGMPPPGGKRESLFDAIGEVSNSYMYVYKLFHYVFASS